MKPFSRRPAETIAALGETALLRAIRTWLGDVSPPSPRGMGDDCAVLDFGRTSSILAKCDGVVYRRHFGDSTPPAAVGAKLLKRNLSDVAAMGGTPKHALIHLVTGRNLSTKWLKRFYLGLAQTCRNYGVTLAGGGSAQGPDSIFAADVTLLGIPGPRVLLRTGAKLGDAIFVTGRLGGSLLGHHLTFIPRLAEGRWLAHQPGVRCLMDVTDGLAKDLPEILPVEADARLDVSALPIAPAAKVLAQCDGRSAREHALTDGEDFELVFTVNSRTNLDLFARHWRKQFGTPLACLGVIVPALDQKKPRQLRELYTGDPILSTRAHGFEHFRRQS